MKEIIKKYWFVAIIGVFLLSGVFYFAADTLQTNVKAKQTEDGVDVVFSYDGKDYTADQLYDEVYDTIGIGAILPVLELEVYRDAMETTAAMESDAKAQAQNIVASLKQEYGEEWEFSLNRLLVQSGYISKSGVEGLEDYLMIMEVRDQIEKAYIKDNPQSYADFIEEQQPRMISHILIKMEDKDNPTAEEQEKLDKAKAAVSAAGADFAKVAAEFSDDGSAQNGGSLGINTKESINSYVPEFKDKVYSVEVGEMTEWFKTTYGYHIIRVDADTLEGFESLNNYDFYKMVIEAKPKLLLDITWDQIQKQEITFGDNSELNQAIKDHYTAKEED